MLGRERLSAVFLGVAGVVLFASLFLPWYDAEGVLERRYLALFGATDLLTASAWRTFSRGDIALAVIAAYIVLLAPPMLRGWRPSLRLTSLLAVPVVAGLGYVIVEIAAPPPVTTILRYHESGLGVLALQVRYGAIVALASLALALAALALGSLGLRNVAIGSLLLAVITLAGCGGQKSLRTRLAGWVNVGDCVMTNHGFSPQGGQVGYPRGFLERASLRVVIACTTGGPLTNYFRFASHGALLRALADYPQVRKRRLCVLGKEMFDGDSLAGGNAADELHVSDLCRRVHGSLVR